MSKRSTVGSSSRRGPLHSAPPVDPIVSTRRHTLGTLAPDGQPTMVLTRSLPTKRRSGPVRTVSAAGASTINTIRRSSRGTAAESTSARRSSSWVPNTSASPSALLACGSQATHSQPRASSETTTIWTSAGPSVVAIWTTSERSSALTACGAPATANASAGGMTIGITASLTCDHRRTAASCVAEGSDLVESPDSTTGCSTSVPRPSPTRTPSRPMRRLHTRRRSPSASSIRSTRSGFRARWRSPARR